MAWTIEAINPHPSQQEVGAILNEAGLNRKRTPFQVHLASACGYSRPVVESYIAQLLYRDAGQINYVLKNNTSIQQRFENQFSEGKCDNMRAGKTACVIPEPFFIALPTMIHIIYLPACVTCLFRGMSGIWKSQHRLMLCWLIVMQALFPGRKTLAELARWTPVEITAGRLRRMLKAVYWDVHLLGAWWAYEALQTLPPPEDGVLTLTGDGSVTSKPGKHNPLAQQGRKNAQHPWFFGLRFALLIVSWDT